MAFLLLFLIILRSVNLKPESLSVVTVFIPSTSHHIYFMVSVCPLKPSSGDEGLHGVQDRGVGEVRDGRDLVPHGRCGSGARGYLDL